jgi:predicted nucleotidyltransferase
VHLAALALRDRDAIVTDEGLIFRVLGYSHPPDAYVCDAEYASATIFRSGNPRAFRNGGQSVFYKFYGDEGWRFVENSFPQYMVRHGMLRKKVVGINRNAISEVRKPEDVLKKLLRVELKDSLVAAMQNVLNMEVDQCGLSVDSFGVFGSLLHGFHHPEFSDIDLIVYGKDNVARLCKVLLESYETHSSPLHNEFETDESIRGKVWRFRNYTPKEFLWHQRRKLIYSLYDNRENGRTIKTEFEPVKGWSELRNEYDPYTRVFERGWVRMLARVIRDDDAPFMPSAYSVEPLRVVRGEAHAQQVGRILSYLEEFRMQAFEDETVYVEGNLEEVRDRKDNHFQVVLTYCPRYYEQVLKSAHIG